MDAKKNLVIDIAALLVYLIVANPALTGAGVHEWLGLGLLVVFFVHCMVHYDWIAEALLGFRSNPSWVRRGNLVLDIVILFVFMVVMVSGFGVSGDVLPALGFYAGGYYFWDPLHAVSAKILLALLLMHVVVHAKWLYNSFRKSKTASMSKARRTDGHSDGL